MAKAYRNIPKEIKLATVLTACNFPHLVNKASLVSEFKFDYSNNILFVGMIAINVNGITEANNNPALKVSLFLFFA